MPQLQTPQYAVSCFYNVSHIAEVNIAAPRAPISAGALKMAGVAALERLVVENTVPKPSLDEL